MENSDDLIVITVNGPDAPGIVSSIISILSVNAVKIIDIEQIVIRKLILLSMMLDLRESKGGQISLLKDLLLEARRLNVELDFKIVSVNEHLQYDKNFMYAVTCLGEQITADVLAQISHAIYSENVNIERITQLGQGELSCIEMIVKTDKTINVPDMTRKLLSISSDFGVDIAVQKENIFRRSKRLVVMDMDSTLIQVEVIDELAKVAGNAEEVRGITRKAMNGELSFNESLNKRVEFLRGLDENILDEIYHNIPFTPGAKKLVKILKKLGYKTAVISGGFTFFTDRLKNELGLDYAFANKLEIKNGKLTGKVIGDIINGEFKAKLLEEIANKENISLDQVVAIGDGANDLLMLDKAGLGIAFNAHKTVREKADYNISQKNLDSIIYLLGISEKEKNTI
ncbi:MAG: phosphoserine phosphatase SerB [Candidatus Scalindua sp. AMX11]|nr:MAG: phosphoserine phosphatase SerB [Candidatus Scalindua sp.]NOG82854.1 phosphoserine phosphatase SerB [Planctomycetota bacterium]RZV86198.1 MAG: phosphoserine phosphatase SerB [Candidatus Scalindua sp. SCAELEC01]TDE65889.1 MAG: phosphoserine phosphatase SerB [Candidatus Scalindua sp. AMX11]